MKNFILTRVIGGVGEKVDGYKMKGAGVAAILMAVLGFIHLLFPDIPGLPELEPMDCWYALIAGIALIGGAGKGAKIEKGLKVLADIKEKK